MARPNSVCAAARGPNRGPLLLSSPPAASAVGAALGERQRRRALGAGIRVGTKAGGVTQGAKVYEGAQPRGRGKVVVRRARRHKTIGGER